MGGKAPIQQPPATTPESGSAPIVVGAGPDTP